MSSDGGSVESGGSLGGAGLTRREVVAKALLAGAGATIVGALPKQASAAPAAVPGDRFDPKFLSGQVLATHETGELVVMEGDDRIRSARMAAQTDTWKSGDWGLAPLTAGDCIYATGVLGVDDVFAVERAWVGLRTFPGKVRAIEDYAMTVELSGGREVEALITPRTMVQAPTGRLARGMSPRGVFAVEDQAYLVGYVTNERFTVTTAYQVLREGSPSPSERGPVKGSPTVIDGVDGPQTVCPLTWKGVATLFCCGGVSGCGSCNYHYCCGSSNQGLCNPAYPCYSYNHSMAWPHVGSCDAACESCCGNVMQFACGKDAFLSNPCTSDTDVSKVVDCGPNIHCVPQFGCDNRTTVRFDLTPCSFAAIGGSFEAGMVTCDCTFYTSC